MEAGARPEIILIDNQRIVLNRDILVRQAQRDLLNSNLSLGLFTPSLSLDPSILPSTPPRIPLVTQNQFQSDLSYAMETHPEVLSLNQRQKSNQVDQELAQNMLLPQLDLTAELNRSVREDSPKDIERNEIVAGLSLTFPLARNQAKGQLKTAKQTQQQLSLKKQFALSKLNADLNTAYNNLQTNYKAWHLTEESQTLALKLYKAEESLFDEGASDLLKLQIRENALVDAKMATLKSLYQYLSSYSDYIAITARDLQ